MKCYEDITFCAFYEGCNIGKNCNRALTEKVKQDAEMKRLRICRFIDKPNCFMIEKNK